MIPTLLVAVLVGLADVPGGAVRVGPETAGNIQVRLVGAGRDRTVVGFLHARFITVGDGDPRPILIRFKSNAHTTHEETLIRVIESCCSASETFGGEGKADKLDAVFSIPKGADGNDLSRWFLVSLSAPGSTKPPDASR